MFFHRIALLAAGAIAALSTAGCAVGDEGPPVYGPAYAAYRPAPVYPVYAPAPVYYRPRPLVIYRPAPRVFVTRRWARRW